MPDCEHEDTFVNGASLTECEGCGAVAIGPAPAAPSCETCRYSELAVLEEAPKGGPGPALLCRRNPPTPAALPSDETGFWSEWPVVEPSDWCGEWKEAR